MHEYIMDRAMAIITSLGNVGIIWILIAVLLMINNEYRKIGFMALGAGVISNVLKIIFHRLGPSGALYTFPSGESLMTVVTYGFLAYMIVKYSKKVWINSVVISVCLCIYFLIGLSMVYLNLQYPSNIVAGYEFGVVWLSLSMVVLEIYRVLPKLKG